MKLSTDKLPAAQMSGEMVTMNMGISDNADDQLMILNVLSSTLYTDKVAAVLREYGCNAYDANVEAGKATTPIEVNLPTKLEPSLRIRDFGFGMTEEQIANTFVKLGRSTKRQSNEFTGMLGIGSKSGFAYGDSFMITSFTGGKKVVYNAFRDRGAPRLARMLVSESKEPDGIEIKVPVRMEHFQEFQQKAERVYRYFRVRPKISVTFNDAERLMSGTGWHFTASGRSVAIMGNVGYDLTSTGMGGYSLEEGARQLLDLGVELEFKIGDLEIAASREGLQYKDLTKKAVLDRLKVMVQEIGDTMSQKIKTASCLWEAQKIYGEVYEKIGSTNTRALYGIIDGKVKWQGHKLSTGRFDLANNIGPNGNLDPEVNVFRVWKDLWRPTSRSRQSNPRECYASDKVTLIINDLPGKSQSPARERGFFEDPANKDKTDYIVFTFQTDAAQKRYWKAKSLDGAPTILLSSITPAVSVAVPGGAPRAHNSKHSAKAFVWDEAFVPGYAAARSAYWKQETVDLKSDSGVYVILDGFFIKTPAATIYNDEGPDYFARKVKLMREAKLIDGPLYGFKIAAKAKLGPGWVPLETAIETKLNSLIQKAAQQAADYVMAQHHYPIIDPAHEKLFPKSSVRDYLSQVTQLRSPKDSQLMKVLVNPGQCEPWLPKVKLPSPSVSLDRVSRDVIKEYPLLGHISNLNNLRLVEIAHVAEHIRLVCDA